MDASNSGSDGHRLDQAKLAIALMRLSIGSVRGCAAGGGRRACEA